MDFDLIGKSLVSVNRSAHRSKKPGITKCKLEIKNMVLCHLTPHLVPIATQEVNRRSCLILRLGNSRWSFHCPMDKAPAKGMALPPDLPSSPSFRKAKWDAPLMRWELAIENLEAELTIDLPVVKLLTCPRCKQGWRHALINPLEMGEAKSSRQFWAKATTRICPDCFVPRHLRFDFDDDWEDFEEDD